MKNEKEVMGRYAQALASACTIHGAIVGPLVVCQDIMRKAGETKSNGATRALIADVRVIQAWVVRTLTESLRDDGIKGGD